MSSFTRFLFDNDILTMSIGTMIGFATTNFMKELNHRVITRFLEYAKVKNAGLLGAVIEYALIILIVYITYLIILRPLFRDHIEQKEEAQKDEHTWRNDLLDQVSNLDLGAVHFS